MVTVVRVQRGGVIPLTLTVRELRTDSLNGQRVHPSGASVATFNPDGTAQQASTAADYVDTGTFIFYWDTTNLSSGDYRAKVRIGYAFSSATGGATKVLERDLLLRLVNAV